MDFTYDSFNRVVDYELYLCNPDMTELGVLQTRGDREVTLRFNDLSEFDFEVPKVIKSQSGEIIETLYYDLIETRRLVYITDIGYFRITEVEEKDSGADVYKSVSCESHQTMFKDFGFTTEERVYKLYDYSDPTDKEYDSTDDSAVPSIVGQMCQQLGVSVVGKDSITTDPTVTNDYKNWTVVYVNSALVYKDSNETNVCRTFSEETTNGYDFLRNDVEDAFEIIIEFDFKYHTIKFYTVEEVTKSTNIYLSHQNLLTSFDVTENADNLVTVMTMQGSDDLDISLVNPAGTPWVFRFDYYKRTVDDNGNKYPWMSKELIAAIDEVETNYEATYNGDYVFYDDDGNVDTSTKTNTEAYKAFVLNLKELYQEQAELSEQITYVNTKLKDIKEIISELESGDAEGSEIFTAEEVDVGETSLYPTSEYYGEGNEFYNENTTYTFYEDVNYDTDNKVFAGDESDTVLPNKTIGSMVDTSTGDIVTNGDKACPYFFDSEEVETTTVTTTKETEVSTLGYTISATEAGLSEAKVTVTRDSACPANTALYVYIQYYCKNLVSGASSPSTDIVQFSAGDQTVTKTIKVGASPSNFKITKIVQRVYKVVEETNVIGIDPYTYCKLTSEVESVEVDDDGNTTTIYAVAGFKRYTTYDKAADWLGWYDDKLSQLNTSYNLLQDNIDYILAQMDAIAAKCNIITYFKANHSDLLPELYAYWSLGDYTNDNYAVLDSTTMAEQLELAEELMEAGETELEYASQPEYKFTAEAVNFLTDERYKSWAKEIKLGNVVTVERGEDLYYYPALTEITFNLDDRTDFTMTFSNSLNLSDWAYTWGDMVESASSTSKTVNQNWGSLTSYSSNKDVIQGLLYDPLNATLRMTQRNLYNQDFVVDETGILGRKYTDESKTDFEEEQVRMTNNVIIFTDDGWQTAKTALGKIVYNAETGDTAYGLLAEVIVGDLIMSETLRVINQDNTVLIDDSGITILDSSETVVFSASSSGVYIYNYATTTDLDNALYDDEGNAIYATSTQYSTLSSTVDGLSSTVETISGSYVTSTTFTTAVNGVSARVSTIEEDYVTSGELALTIEEDDSGLKKAYLSGNADYISFNATKYITINSPYFTLDQYGNINAMGGNIANFEIYESQDETVTILIAVTSSTNYTVTSDQNDQIENDEGNQYTYAEYVGTINFEISAQTTDTIVTYKYTYTYWYEWEDDDGDIHISQTSKSVTGSVTIEAGETTGKVNFVYGNYTASSPSVSATAVCYATKKVLRYNKETYDDDNEGVYLGTDGIGLGAGAFYVDSNGTLTLHSSNFTIGSETSGGTTTTYLRFNNDDDEDATYIDDVHITSPTVNCTTLSSSTANLTTAYLGDVTIEDEGITCGSTAINMNQGGTTISVTATVAQASEYSNEIILTLSQSISCSCSFVVAYTYGFSGGNSAVDIITVPANTTSVTQTFDGGFWGVRSVYFPSTSSSTLTFSHKTSAAIEITGDLLPSIGTSDGYALGSSTLPWITVYTQDESGGSDRKIKDNIEDLSLELSESLVKNLVPRQFIFKNDKFKRPHYGFIAQEVESEMKSMGLTVFDNALIFKTDLNAPDSDANFYGLNYRNLIAPLFKVVQNLLERIESLENSSNILED